MHPYIAKATTGLDNNPFKVDDVCLKLVGYFGRPPILPESEL